uniref:Uncharacterized protein n=1 Tax=Branchiostoma floridae TaxID=7739 RepID=C3ZWW9_BRAFL|eukprot:XP_002586969.1 hypothetical protein BRAFLDRAFT_99330 [Branchiostoma floridae]
MALKGSTKIKRKPPKRNEDSRRRVGDASEPFDVEGLGLKAPPTTLFLVRNLRCHITAMESELECCKVKKEMAERKTKEAEKNAARKSLELTDNRKSVDKAVKEKATAKAHLESQQKAHIRFRRDLDHLKSVKDLSVEAMENAVRQTERIVSELDSLKQRLDWTSEMMQELKEDHSSTDKQSRAESSLSCVAKKTNVKLPKIYGNYTLSKTNMLGPREEYYVLNNTRKVPVEKDCGQDGVILPKVNNITLQNKARK